MRTNFDNCKVRISDEITSRRVKERLLELGMKPFTDEEGEIYGLHINRYGNFWLAGRENYEFNSWEEVSVEDILGEDCPQLHVSESPYKFDGYNYLEGSFMWAVEQMKQGKKVRRKGWLLEDYYFIEGEYIKLSNRDEPHNLSLNPLKVEATDWEIYEEPKKTLWDKPVIWGGIPRSWYNEIDVKEALQEYLNCFPDEPHHIKTLMKLKAKEIFGEELL